MVNKSCVSCHVFEFAVLHSHDLKIQYDISIGQYAHWTSFIITCYIVPLTYLDKTLITFDGFRETERHFVGNSDFNYLSL